MSETVLLPANIVATQITSVSNAERMWHLYNQSSAWFTRNNRPWARDAFERWWGLMTLDTEYRQRHWWGWVYAWVESPPCGFGLLTPELGQAEPSLTLGIDDRYRRLGLGTAIYRHLAAEVQQLGYPYAWAEMQTANTGSWKAAEEAGWTRVAEATLSEQGSPVYRYVSIPLSVQEVAQAVMLDGLKQMPGDVARVLTEAKV
jgi:GNAT superfamily N-acetyltransferase